MALSRIVRSDTRRALNATDARWKFKAILHITTLVTSLMSISLFASSIPLWNANFFHNRGPNRGDWTDGMPLGPLAFTFIMTAASLACIFMRRRSFPPKITMATTALILVTLALSLIFAGQGSLFKHWQPPAARSQSNTITCTLVNLFTRECEPILYQIGERQIAGIAFGTFTWILVLMTFLLSLYEHRASQIGEIRKSRGQGMRRLSLVPNGQRRYKDIEKGATWIGSGSNHSHTSNNSSRSSQGSRQHRYERSRDHRQHGTSKHYRSGVKNGSGDTVPFVFVREPEIVHPHPGVRYM